MNEQRVEDESWEQAANHLHIPLRRRMNTVLAILVCFNMIISSSSAEPIQDDFTFRRYSLRATNNMRLPPRLLGLSMSMSMPEIPNPNLVPCGTFDSSACPEMTSVVDSVSPSTKIPTVVFVDISQPTTDNKEADVETTPTTTDGTCRRDSDCSGSDQISTKTCECRFECAFCSMIPMFHVESYCGTCV